MGRILHFSLSISFSNVCNIKVEKTFLSPFQQKSEMMNIIFEQNENLGKNVILLYQFVFTLMQITKVNGPTRSLSALVGSKLESD